MKEDLGQYRRANFVDLGQYRRANFVGKLYDSVHLIPL